MSFLDDVINMYGLYSLIHFNDFIIIFSQCIGVGDNYYKFKRDESVNLFSVPSMVKKN